MLLLSLCATFNSCDKDKDGIYNPKQKIKKVYLQEENSPKQLQQEWFWEKNKLTKVNQYYFDKIISSSTYSYEKNRLVKISNGFAYTLITYNGNKYKKMESFILESPLISIDFIYNKDKISKMLITVYDFFDLKKSENKFLSTIIPEEVISKMFKSSKNKGNTKSSDPYVVTVTLKYDGDNIKETISEFETIDGETRIKEKMVVTYTSYDKKNNPNYKNFIGDDFSSKNNPLEVNITSTTTYTESYFGEITTETISLSSKATYSYTYDKNDFPIEVRQTQIEYDDDDVETNVVTTYYEYQ